METVLQRMRTATVSLPWFPTFYCGPLAIAQHACSSLLGMLLRSVHHEHRHARWIPVRKERLETTHCSFPSRGRGNCERCLELLHLHWICYIYMLNRCRPQVFWVTNPPFPLSNYYGYCQPAAVSAPSTWVDAMVFYLNNKSHVFLKNKTKHTNIYFLHVYKRKPSTTDCTIIFSI